MALNRMAEQGYSVSKAALRRKMFLFGAAAGSVISLLCAWLDWQNGLISSIPQDIVLALVLIPLYIWARNTDDPTPPTRVGMMVLVLSFIPSIPEELVQMPVFLLWLPAISLLAFYFFGFREGLIWSAGFMALVLAESLRVLSDVQNFQHEAMFIVGITVYLFLGAMAAAFQYMIESYERQLLAEAEEKQRVSARMAEVQKLESIGVLAGGIAHDFNNLLVAIMGNAELAALDAPPDHPEQHYLDNILRAARRGADLVGQMLAYSGQGQISRGMQNFNALIRDVSELLGTVIGKHLRLNMTLDKALPDIYGDRNQLTQLMMNLLTNASDAMEGKPGEISLRTGVRHLSQQDFSAMHTLAGDIEPGEFVFIEVKDSGCGMDTAIQARIFDPFFTTKQTGTGLGLAALQGIVRSHGGTMSLVSAPGAGSCFTIYFPQYNGPSEVVERQPVQAMSAPQLHGAVLVVDDEEDVLDVARRLLEREGIAVLTACDGAEAVRVFRQHADEIALVLMDQTMPVMDGEQAFHAIREIRPDTVIILSSGFPECEVAERLRRVGLTGFLRKPYQRSALLNEISQAQPALDS